MDVFQLPSGYFVTMFSLRYNFDTLCLNMTRVFDFISLTFICFKSNVAWCRPTLCS